MLTMKKSEIKINLVDKVDVDDEDKDDKQTREE